jgi:hypothetical protein
MGRKLLAKLSTFVPVTDLTIKDVETQKVE